MEHVQIRADTDILSDDFFKRILAESWKDNQILEADYTSLCAMYANEIEQIQGTEKADIFCDKATEKWQEYTAKEKQAGKNIVCEKGVFKVKTPPQLEIFTADELLQMELPELKTVVTDILKIGVTVLSAKSKMYKSWMCLQMGIAVATGTEFLGKKTVKSDVLYVDLENDKRISKERLLKLLAGDKPPNNLFIVNDVPTMENGFTKTIEAFISTHPDIHLLIIDIFAKIKYQKKSNQNDYDCDYKSISELKKLAEQYDLAIILVSHNRKMTDDTDAFTNILGSSALMGASDEAIVIYKARRTDTEATISITGRTVESNDFKATFDKDTCKWKLLGSCEEYEEQRKRNEYEQNPIVATIKKLVLTNSGTWRGKVTEIISSSKYYGSTIYDSAGTAGKKLKKLLPELEENDCIRTEIKTAGKASATYVFTTENPFEAENK